LTIHYHQRAIRRLGVPGRKVKRRYRPQDETKIAFVLVLDGFGTFPKLGRYCMEVGNLPRTDQAVDVECPKEPGIYR
jgi:hypothetical protein